MVEKLKLLEEQGLAEDTIIFYYGDHGQVCQGGDGRISRV